MTADQVASELRAAIEQVEAGRSGWLEVKRYWWRDPDQMLDFMMAKGRRGLPLLQARLAEVEATGSHAPDA
ncbi:hypothetical protein [Rhodobacter sp. 24-YEA-8]|uniref:hypothetical protein n=1 Tax=Rhodobacter sp. 24-YEA-8 TaxID=1884310 RepID=UPI00089A4E2B|nr:hypothetical protein [Rhodobacter sp. 24-YEA-8]SEB67769.1 hypothetical protein SAMN05519105_1068 [Rhodobacter sp. 24-YEA-8]